MLQNVSDMSISNICLIVKCFLEYYFLPCEGFYGIINCILYFETLNQSICYRWNRNKFMGDENLKKKKKKTRVSGRKVLLIFLVVISAVAGFAVAKVESTMKYTLNQVKRNEDSLLSDVDLSGIKVASDKEVVNILLIGDDYRKQKNYTADGLTDVMMIATMDKKHNTLKLTSLMRDTLVEVTEVNELKKLNSAKSVGGVQNLYKTIATNFNIKLDGYVMIGFDAFEKMVNAVGGVKIEITDTEARYLNCTNYIRKKKNRNLTVGKQKLNGDQALAYCRIRKGRDKIGEPVVTANGLIDDYGRTWRQRTVINAVFQKMKTLPLNKWVEVANKVLSSVETDLDNDAILSYIKDMVMMGTTDIHQLQIPKNGYFRNSLSGEFSAGDCLVATNGIDSTYDITTNAEILKQFVFDYDGEGEFTYPAKQTTE